MHNKKNTGTMLLTYPRLRDGIYLVSILLCFLAFLLYLDGFTSEIDGSLQRLFFSQEHEKTLLTLFSCATTLGFSFLPNLLIETMQIMLTEEGAESFLLERYLFILSFTTPSLVGFCGLYNKYEHTAILFITTTNISWITYIYITTRVLESSIYMKVWTRNVILAIYSSHCVLLSVIVPFVPNFTMKMIIGACVFIVTLSYFMKYLKIINIKQILFGGDRNEWKESVIVHVSIGYIIFSVLHFVKIFMYKNYRFNK